MKKWIKNVMAGAVVLSSSLGLAGCGLFNDEPSKEGYVFKNYEDTYYVNEPFSIVGTKLRITDKKGNTKEIVVTEEMVKHAPDMSTPGEKVVIIEYNGVEYTFTITIENRTNEQLLAKLQNFLRRYESDKDSLIEAGIITNLQAKYLDEVANIDEQEAITLLSQMFDNDKLLNAGYNSLFDAIVQGSFDLDESYIVSSNDLKAKLDTLKVLQSAKQSISDFDMRTYLIDLILPKTDAYYINNISDYISEVCQIKSVSGKMSINNVISTYCYKLKNFEKFELADAYTELLNQINVHTVNPVIKEATTGLNSKDPEILLHLPSSMIEKQWLNYGKVMTPSNYAMHSMADAEPIFVTGSLANSLVRQQASNEKAMAYMFENTVKNLINCSSIEELENIVLNCLQEYATYSDEMLNIIQTQQQNQILLVLGDSYGWYESVIGGRSSSFGIFGEGQDYTFEPNYQREIDTYTELRDNCQKYYNDIDGHGFIGAVEQNALVEELFESFDYPEENKQEAIDNIYDLLNRELEGEDLYWALADVLFPHGADEHIEEVKNIVKSYLSNGLVSAIEENELVEKLMDFIGNYPEEHKQQAIDTIYSILKDEKTGKDLYLDVVKVLTPNENDYYIDYACDMINEYLSIESVTGQEEIRDIITKYFENLKTATEFDVREAYSEILTAINIHSTNEIVKTATKDLESLEIEQMVHIISDVVYTDRIEQTKIATSKNGGDIYSDYQLIESFEAQNLINRFSINLKNQIRACEDVVWNLLNSRSINELFDTVLEFTKAEETCKQEEISIVEILNENEWMLGDEYLSEWYDGYGYHSETRFGERYEFDVEHKWNSETKKYEYVFDGYSYELRRLNNNKEELAGLYNQIDLFKSLIFEPGQAIDKLLEQHKQEVVETALEICYDYLGVERDSYMASDLEDLFNNAIDDYLNDTLDKEQLLTDIEDIINTYATDETRTVLNVGYMLYNALNYDESVDYNEVFKDIELPKQVESVDYNKLMSQVMDKETYEIFTFNDIEVEYITDDSGKIVAEKLTLKVDVDFDVLISSLKGEVTFTLTLDFDPEYEEDDKVSGGDFDIFG